MSSIRQFAPLRVETKPSLAINHIACAGNMIRWRGKVVPDLEVDNSGLKKLMAEVSVNKLAPVFTLSTDGILDGWAKVNSPKRVTTEQSLSHTLREMDLREVASGIYMDDASMTWNVEKNGSSVIITRQVDADEIDAILEQASSKGSTESFVSPLERTGLPSGVVWADDYGELASGVAFNVADGTPSMIKVMPMTDSGPERKSLLVHPLHIVAAGGLDIKISGATPDSEVASIIWRNTGGSSDVLDDIVKTVNRHTVQ